MLYIILLLLTECEYWEFIKTACRTFPVEGPEANSSGYANPPTLFSIFPVQTL